MSASSDNARNCCVHFVFVIMKLGLEGFWTSNWNLPFLLLLSFQLKRTARIFLLCISLFFLFLGQKFGKRWHNSFKGNIFSQLLWFFNKETFAKLTENWFLFGRVLPESCHLWALWKRKESPVKSKSTKGCLSLCLSQGIEEKKTLLCSAVWSHIQSFFFFFLVVKFCNLGNYYF